MILEQTLPQCNCTRGIESFGKSISGQSSCSKPALTRGSHQKVIAFTFFVGPTFDKLKRDYLAGIEKNFLNMQSMYGSEWVMRLYYNIQGNQELLDHICSLACFKSNIELCDLAEKNENFDLSAISNATVHIGGFHLYLSPFNFPFHLRFNLLSSIIALFPNARMAAQMIE